MGGGKERDGVGNKKGGRENMQGWKGAKGVTGE